MKIHTLIFLCVGTLFLHLDVAAQTAQTNEIAAVTINNLAGSWRGMYGKDPSFVEADMSLTPTDNGQALTGELHYTVVTHTHSRRAPLMPQVHGSYQVRATFNPETRILTIEPTIRATDPPNTEAHKMVAVYSTQQDGLAGKFIFQQFTPEWPYFVFVRSGSLFDELEQLARNDGVIVITQSVRTANVRRNREATNSLPAAFPDDAALIEWASRYKKEYANENWLKINTGIIEKRALPLLNDSAFKSVFGDAYDVINQQLIEKTAARFRPNSRINIQAAADASGPRSVDDYGYMQYVLQYSEPKVVAVKAMRILDAWKAELLLGISGQSMNGKAFSELAVIQKAITNNVDYAWPSDQVNVNTIFMEAKIRLAGPMLAKRLDDAINSASDVDGAKKLANWEQDNKDVLDFSGRVERDATEQRINQKLDQILESLIADDERAHMIKGDSLQILAIEADLYRTLIREYSHWALERPPVQHAIQRLQSRRDAELAAAAADLTALIKKQKTVADVDQVTDSYLQGVAGDAFTPAGRQIMDIAQKQKDKINKEMAFAIFSAREHKLMDTPGHIVVPSHFDAPTTEEVRLALLRTMAQNSPSGQVLDPNSVRYSTFVGAIFNSSAVFHIESLEFIASPVSDADSGFDCAYKLHYRITSQTMTTIDRTSSDVNRFDLGQQGWWSPSAADRVINGQTQSMKQWDDNLRRFFHMDKQQEQ